MEFGKTYYDDPDELEKVSNIRSFMQRRDQELASNPLVVRCKEELMRNQNGDNQQEPMLIKMDDIDMSHPGGM